MEYRKISLNNLARRLFHFDDYLNKDFKKVALKRLIRRVTHPEISMGLISRRIDYEFEGPNDHKINILHYLPEYEDVKTIYVDGESYIDYSLDYSKDQLLSEVRENLEFPPNKKGSPRYLKSIKNELSEVNSQIVGNHGRLGYENKSVTKDLDSQLLKYEEELSRVFSHQKRVLRETIKEICSIEASLFNTETITGPLSKSTQIKDPDDSLTVESEEQDVTTESVIKSFTWSKMRNFKIDMVNLYGLLVDNNMIPQETDFNDFCKAFSGTNLVNPLNIKWLVTGKNKETSKSSLFHFLSLLEDENLIDNNDWEKGNYTGLYKKIIIVFADKEGNLFSSDGLKSSRCQGLKAECARQTEINKIVEFVAHHG